MGIECDQVVIGQGASALSFLHFAREANNRELVARNALTYVIGEDDLWAKISKAQPGHTFGQPLQIVSKPGTAPPTTASPQFQKATDIHAQLGELRQDLAKSGIQFRSGRVIRVARSGERFAVTTQDGVEYNPKQVIVATGFGPSSRPPRGVLPENVTEFSDKIYGGTEYLYESIAVPPRSDFTVAVMGASATSAWVVGRAMALGAQKILWISRDDFQLANPAGINSAILRFANKHGCLVIAAVSSVRPEGDRLLLVLDKASKGPAPIGASISTLGYAYKRWYELNKQSPAAKRNTELALTPRVIEKQEEPIVIDHFVYALGADSALPGGAKHLLGPIVDELQPVFDDDKRFGDVAADTTVAFKTGSGDVWVVGAAVFRMVGLNALREDSNVGLKFSNIARMMCEAGAPPEGIAAVFASMKALTGFVATGPKLNLQTADFKEAETWISELYLQATGERIPELTKRVMADQIIALRKHTVFGLTAQEVARLTDLTDQNSIAFWGDMFKSHGPKGRLIDVIAVAAAREAVTMAAARQANATHPGGKKPAKL